MAMPVFAGQKLVVVGGSSGMGRQTAADVVAAGGSAVIIGQDPGKIDNTVQTLAKDGPAYGITADLTDRMQAEQVRRQLAGEHADATLLVNAAGLFVPKPFLDYDGACYDPYAERGEGGGGGGWAHQAIGATPSSAYSLAKGGTAHAHPQPGPRARPPPDPGQRGRAGRRRDPDLREVRPG